MIEIGPEIDAASRRRAAEAYGGAFVSELQLRFPFSRGTDVEWIRRHLEQWGGFYLWERDQLAGRAAVHAKWRAHEAQLGRIARAAGALREALASLEPDAAAFFWRDARNPLIKMMSEHPDVGTMQLVHNAKGQSSPVSLLNEENLIASVAMIENIAKDACARVAFKPGKPRKADLQHWVAQMRILFITDFGQAFTYSNGSDGPSLALQFCLFTMEPLDGEVTAREMAWAVRSTVQTWRPPPADGAADENLSLIGPG